MLLRRGIRSRGCRASFFVAICLLCLTTLSSFGDERVLRDGDALAAAEELLARFEDAMGRLREYSCTFTKREWKDGRQLPEEVIFLKFRVDPRSVYMRWIGVEKRGQELLWRPDWNEGRIHVHPGGFGSFVAVNLDPLGAKATASSRHPVTEAGFPHLLRLLRENVGLLREKSASGLRLYPSPEDGEGECIILELPKWKNADLYCYRTEFCFQKETSLPKRVRSWDFEDGDQRLVEDYMYEDLRENPEFSDADFSPENPAYDFPGNSPSRRAW